MANKPSKKTTPRAVKTTGSKSKTAHAKSAEAEGTKSKAKTSNSKLAQAADGKTKAKAKSTTKSAAAKRKPAQPSASDSKTSSTKGKKAPAQSSHAETSHRKSAAHQSNGSEKGANGRAGGMAVRPTGTTSRVKSRDTHGGRDLGRNQPKLSEQTDRISSALFQALESHATAYNLGHVAREGQFDWGEVENPNLRPDLAFISFDRWAAYRNVPTALTWHVVPDLVVEFLTEDEKTEEFGTRLDDYFKAGVGRVWVVYPDLRIFDYQSPSEYQILHRDQTLDGGSTLPGFQVPIKELAEEN
jgi:Putative restriction endonuclease